MYYFSILYSFYPFIFQGGHNLVKLHLMKLKMAETESFNQRNAPRLTGGTPATRRRKVGGRSGSPHRGRRARRGVSGAPSRRAVRPARAGAGELHGLLRQVVPDSMLQCNWVYEIDERVISEGLNP